MTNTQLTVVGKVSNGRMVTLATTGTNVIGKVTTVHTHARTHTPVLVPTIVTPSHTPEVTTYAPIDSPFISMVQANHIRMREEKVARMEAITIENKRNQRINTIKNLFKGMIK